jgi:hypothetical protein
LADATQKIEDLQRDAELQKTDVAQNHIHVELLEEGVKDFTEETNVDKGHEFFMALNDVLAGHAAWIPSMKRMKAYFKKQRIRQTKDRASRNGNKRRRYSVFFLHKNAPFCLRNIWHLSCLYIQ